jgi:hypothetical protein
MTMPITAASGAPRQAPLIDPETDKLINQGARFLGWSGQA